MTHTVPVHGYGGVMVVVVMYTLILLTLGDNTRTENSSHLL